MDRVQQMKNVLASALVFYGREKIPETSDFDHVYQVADALRDLMDAELRHVALYPAGLVRTLCRLFVECLCLLRDRRGGTIKSVSDWLIDDVFAPKNALYDDSFSDFGAVGVVIRLLDHVKALKAIDGDRDRALAHVANYSLMTLVLLSESDRGCLP
jgi:hypothetical protein